MQKDKVSIIIPIYNGEKYLDKTLNSILASTYKNIEIILVNDGSSDKSEEICIECQKRDKRIRIFSKNNEGIAEARNFGILKATGKFVCFCDQDDIVSKNMYNDMIEKLNQDESQICICSTARLLNESKVPYEKLENAVYNSDEVLYNILFPILFNGYITSNKNSQVKIYGTIWKYMIAKEIISEINLKFKSFVNYEDDLVFAIELLCSAKKVSTISDIYYFWRVNKASTSNKNYYIIDFEKKLIKLDNYIINLLYKRNVEESIIKEYKKVKNLKNYCEIIKNENCMNQKYRVKRKTLLNYYNETGGRDTVGYISSIETMQFEFRILIFLLDKQYYLLCFCLEKIIRKIKYVINKFTFLARLERKLKKI